VACQRLPEMDQQAHDSSGLSPLTWSLAGIVIVTVAIVFRLFDLELKPLHHDEGVNGLFMTQLMQPRHTWRYDPARYHGPTLYYLAKAAALTVGLTTFAIRLVPAVCGTATVLLAFYLRRWIGSAGSLVAAALIGISPGAIYFSRYFIHESLLVCFTFATVVAVWHYIERPHAAYMILASVMAGLMFATKETALISAGVLIVAALITPPFLALRRRAGGKPLGERREVPGGARSLSEIDQRGSDAMKRESGFPARGLVLVTVCATIFVGINVLFYSSFFANSEGLRDALRSFALWTQTGARDHVHPWNSYIRWLAREEMPLLALGIAGSGVAFWQARNAFVIFVSLWGLGTLLAYSLIPYKTPWLALNMIVPFAIVSGWTTGVLYVRVSAAWRRVLFALGILVASISGYEALVLNFIRYDDDRYPYVYAHTRRGVLDLTRRIDQIRARAGSQVTIAVVSPEQFPLSWYLRGYPAGFYGRLTDTKDPIVIGSQPQDEALRVQLGDRYARIGSYALRPGVDLVLYVRRDLVVPD